MLNTEFPQLGFVLPEASYDLIAFHGHCCSRSLNGMQQAGLAELQTAPLNRPPHYIPPQRRQPRRNHRHIELLHALPPRLGQRRPPPLVPG